MRLDGTTPVAKEKLWKDELKPLGRAPVGMAVNPEGMLVKPLFEGTGALVGIAEDEGDVAVLEEEAVVEAPGAPDVLREVGRPDEGTDGTLVGTPGAPEVPTEVGRPDEGRDVGALIEGALVGRPAPPELLTDEGRPDDMMLLAEA